MIWIQLPSYFGIIKSLYRWLISEKTHFLMTQKGSEQSVFTATLV